MTVIVGVNVTQKKVNMQIFPYTSPSSHFLVAIFDSVRNLISFCRPVYVIKRLNRLLSLLFSPRIVFFLMSDWPWQSRIRWCGSSF